MLDRCAPRSAPDTWRPSPRSRASLLVAAFAGLDGAVACAADAAAAVDDGARLETVLVTATRRVEPMQRVALSMVAFTAEQLEARSLDHLRELAWHVPNLTFAASQNVGEAAANVFIRGIGQEDFIAGSEPGVAFYVDGVYVARTSGLMTGLLDVERLEVLRGPQGTLFGKNAVGGAIHLVSAAPGPEPGRRVTLGGGSDGRVTARAMLNTPLSPRLWLRFAAAATARDGYVRRLPPPAATPVADADAEGDDRSQAARAQLRWAPAQDWTVDLALDGSRRRTGQGATHVDEVNPRAGILPSVNQLVTLGRLPGPRVDASLVTADLHETYAGGRNFIEQDVRGATVTLAHQAGAGEWKLIGAWRDFEGRVRTDLDGSPLDVLSNEFREHQRQQSAELQWNGVVGRVEVHAGLFALRERSFTPPVDGIAQGEVLYTCRCAPGPLPAGASPRRWLGADSLAAYAQASLPLAAGLAVTLGGRQTTERKSVVAEVLALDEQLRPGSRVLAAARNADSWDAFTHRTALEWRADADRMAYLSVARGFKSGGFNVRPVLNLPDLGLAAFAPETATSYELGLRSEWLDRRVQWNLTVFHTDFRDMQLRRQTIQDGVTVTLIGNAARARIRGAEVELAWRPGAAWRLAAGWGRTDARYLDVGAVPGITRDSAFQRTPRDSATLAIDREIAVAGGALRLHLELAHRSREQFQLTPSPYDQGALTLLDARIVYRPRHDRWSVALFGTNLTDERFRTAGRYNGISQLGVALSSVGPPRQVGVEFTLQR